MDRIIAVALGIVICGFAISDVDVSYIWKLLAAFIGSALIALGSLDFGRP